MAGPTVGYAEIKVDFDGDRLIQQAKRLSEEAGRKAGFGYTEKFRAGLTPLARDIGDLIEEAGEFGGNRLLTALERAIKQKAAALEGQIANAILDEEGFKRFVKQSENAADATNKLNSALQRAVDTGQLSEEHYEGMRLQLEGWSKAAQDAEVEQDRLAKAAKDAAEAQKKADAEATAAHRDRMAAIKEKAIANTEAWRAEQRVRIEERALAIEQRKAAEQTTAYAKAVDKLEGSWRRMDGTVRLVLTLIAGAAGDISALGSAAGAGVLALGGSIGQLVTGAVGLGVVFNRLGKDLDQLDPRMRGVAREFDGFKDVLGETADVIAGTAFIRLDGVFDGLSKTLRGLAPSFSKLGVSAGQFLASLQETFEVGSDGFDELDQFISDSADGFAQIGDIAGDLFEALLRGFNRANPLVEQFYGWLGKLVDRFDSFTRSDSFTEWVDNAQRVFGALGDTLDAVGRALNDLSDTAAADRLIGLLDDLTRGIGPLAEALDVISILNPFGLLSEALADLLVAVEPLIVSLKPFAESINEIAHSGIDAVIPAISTFANILAGLINAVPPETLAGIVTGLLALKSLDTIVPALKKAGTAVAEFGVEIYTMPDKVGKLKSLGKGLGLTALFGGVAAAAAGAAGEMNLTAAELTKLEIAFRSGSGGFSQFQVQLTEGAQGADNFKRTVHSMYTDDFFTSGRVWKGVTDAIDGITFGLTDMSSEFNKNESAFTEWGQQLASLANTDLQGAQDRFADLVEKAGGGEEAIRNLLSAFPDYSAKLYEMADAAGVSLDEQDLLNLAVGNMKLPLSQAERATVANAEALAELTGKAAETSNEISDLSDQIRDFGSAQFDVNSTSRAFEAALDDLTASVEENGASLDITTEAGRANQAALDDIAKSALDYSAALLEQTGDQDAASEAIKTGRERLIEAAEQLGKTREEAEEYADSLGLIPDNVKTASEFTKDDDAKAYDELVRQIKSEVTTTATFTVIGYDQLVEAQRLIREMDGSRTRVATGAGGQGGITYASGGIVNGPTRATVGEAGPEAIVPLRRSLSMVDPAVRQLSAIAQGLTPGAQGGGGGRGGRGFGAVFESGAITVQGVTNPERVALLVANRIAQRVGG